MAFSLSSSSGTLSSKSTMSVSTFNQLRFCHVFVRLAATGWPSDLLVEVDDISFHLHKVRPFLTILIVPHTP